MRNKDIMEQRRKDFVSNLNQAFENKDMSEVAQAFGTFGAELQADLLSVAEEYSRTNDSAVLSSRGCRQLTADETKFWDAFAKASVATDPKQALSGIEKTFPITFIDTVMDDIEAEHPLLAAIDFRNTTGITKWIYATGAVSLAAWGKLTSTITEEMADSINEVDFGLSKLSCFIPIPIELLKLGATYIDAYARVMISEALAFGLEKGVVKGTGKDQPIGMVKDLTNYDAGSQTYVDKEAVELTEISVSSYCDLVGQLSVRPNGRSRVISEVLLVVNPTDYITKIIPSTTVLTTDGTYRNNIFPYPTKVVQTEELQQGEAVIGIAKQYKGFIAGTDIEYSDEYQWLEENRVYKGKTRAYGLPADNTSFIKLDISELKPRHLEVQLVDAAGDDTPDPEENEGN